MRSGMPLVACSVVKQLYRFFHLVTAWLYTSANSSALLPAQSVVSNRYLKLHQSFKGLHLGEGKDNHFDTRT